MIGVESFSIRDFELYKAVAVLVAFLAAAGLQLTWPYAQHWRELLRNWRTNFAIAIFNAAVIALLTRGWLPQLIASEGALGPRLLARWSLPWWLQIVACVVILDLLAYLWHRANHKIPLLWRFHAVHHSDRQMDASTAFRFHVGEVLPSLVLRILVIWIFALPLIGVLAFEVIFAFSNAFVHSDTRLPDGIDRMLTRLIVTPALHRKHHALAVADRDRNFGTIFSIWDRLFGTWRDGIASERVAMGIDQVSAPQSRSLRRLLLLPWRSA